MRFRIAFLFVILSAGLLPRAWAQAKEEFNVREHYTKYEYRIPMRDGVHLFTSVYVPKDTSVAYPFLVDRTPYSVAPVWRGPIPHVAGALGRVRALRLHFRLPGCARALHVGGQVRGNAPAH